MKECLECGSHKIDELNNFCLKCQSEHVEEVK